MFSYAESETINYYEGEALKSTPLSVMTLVPTTENVKRAIVFVSNQYGLDGKKMLALVNCESGFNVRAYNPKDTDGLPAYGLFQFKERTFYWFSQKYNIIDSEILSPAQQIELASKMISDGYGHLWGCFKR